MSTPNFPEALNHAEKKWSKKLAAKEISTHRESYDRALRIFNAFQGSGMDPWLNPEGNNNPDEAPQYKVDDDFRLKGPGPGDANLGLELQAKVNHRPFVVATLAEVHYIGGTKHDGKGVSLYRSTGLGDTRPALPSQSPAFQFIDGVLQGLEKQAVDLGVLKPEETAPSPAAA